MKRLKKQGRSKAPKKATGRKHFTKQIKQPVKVANKQANKLLKKKPAHRKIKANAKKSIAKKKVAPVSDEKKAALAMLSFLKKVYSLFKKAEKKLSERKKVPEKKKEPEKKEWKIRTVSQKYLLGPKVAVVCFVFFITLVIILHNKGRFNITEPLSAALLAFVFIVFTAYSLTGLYSAMKMKQKGAVFMIDGYKPCLICKPCMDTERMLAMPGALLEFIGSKTSNKFHSPECRLAKHITQSHVIHFKIKTKGIAVKKPKPHKIAAALFILAITAIIILHKRGIFDIKEPASIAGLAIVLALFFVYIGKGAFASMKSARHKSGVKAAEAMKKMQNPDVAKAGKYETDIDRLYRLVNDTGRVSVGTAAEIFRLKKEQAEEWGRILESHGLIEIEYPAVGEVQLCKKSLQRTE